jgi:hypothetical protein
MEIVAGTLADLVAETDAPPDSLPASAAGR